MLCPGEALSEHAAENATRLHASGSMLLQHVSQFESRVGRLLVADNSQVKPMRLDLVCLRPVEQTDVSVGSPACVHDRSVQTLDRCPNGAVRTSLARLHWYSP